MVCILGARILCVIPLSVASKETVWDEYTQLSVRLMKKDESFIQEELAQSKLKNPIKPAYAKEFGFNPDQPIEWFATDEGKRIMEIILSFQTPSGGWSKRTDMAKEKRIIGQVFGVEEDYIPTFDNGATSTQLIMLAKAYSATSNPDYIAAFNRGFEFVLMAQYPNGGWPQSFPLRGGYHDYITFNDGLMRDLMRLMLNVSEAKNEFNFVSQLQREYAHKSLDLALGCVVNSQVKVNSELTVWSAQYDVKTLLPVKARAYEMVSLASAESVVMLELLMELKSPSPEIVRSIHAAATWYERTKIIGKTWKLGAAQLKDDVGAPPIWSRFYEIGSNKPIFGDRDGSIFYDIEKVSKERREGYAWFTLAPNKALKKYDKWKKNFPNILETK